MRFKTVGVVGAGTMGAGIAQVCALAGYHVVLFDVSADGLKLAAQRMQASVQKAMEKQKAPPDAVTQLQQRVKLSRQLADLSPMDLVIEAIPEDMALKKQLFAQLDKLCTEATCLVSNTSSLSVTAMAAATQRPMQVAGLHFFNPVPQMKLVEVIRGLQTDASLIDNLLGFVETLGKSPVKVSDTPGFIVNRVARSFYGEALRMVQEGVADVAVLDAIVKGEGGFAMGPFELMDLIGIDVNYAVTQSVYNAYCQEARFQPHPLQKQMVDAGLLGRKTKRGFYSYD